MRTKSHNKGMVFLWMFSMFLLLGMSVKGSLAWSQNSSKTAENDDLAGTIISYVEEQNSVNTIASKIVSLHVNNATVFEAVNQLASDNNLTLSYSKEILPENKTVSVDLRQVTFNKAMYMMLEGTGLRYAISDKGKLVLFEAEKELSKKTIQQAETVSGQVVEAETGDPLPGVNITVKGTTIGTSTGSDGNYELGVPSLQDTLVFSFIGYESQEVPINGRTTVNVTLQTQTVMGEEMVVVGYGTTNRADITTSISSVNPDDINISAKPSINDMLFGQAAGLRVTQESAQPGGNVNLSIRGRGDPLIIVDGVVVPSDGLEPGVNFAEYNPVNRGNLAGLKPSDIESIEVLKDASASMYGVEASDGVILITTKSGRAGRMDVSYSSSVSYQQNYDYMQPLKAEQYMRFLNRFEADRYNAENDMEPFGSTPSDYEPRFSQSEINNAGVGTDWVDFILKDGNLTNHNLSISGGSERITYQFSGNFFDQNGTVENSSMQRYNARANMTFEFNDVISFNASVTGSKNFYDNTFAGWQTGGAGANGFTPLQGAFAYPAYLPVRDEDGNFTQFQTTGNPVSQLRIRDETAYNSIFSRFSVDLTLIPNKLTGRLLYGNNYEASERDYFIPSTVNWFDENASRGSLQQEDRMYQTMESYLNFTSDIGEFAEVSAVAGFGQYINEGFRFGLSARGMLDAVNTNRVDGADSNVNSSRWKNIKRSYFTRASFDLLERYVLEGSLRYDGFSQFFPDSKYALFPSGSVAWKLSNEPFFETSDVVSLLKLRASIGITGRPLPSGAAFAAFSPDGYLASFNDGSTNYIPVQATQLDHPELTWEKTIMQNAGIDFGFFEDRISGSFDIFRDDVTDLLNTGANTPALSLISEQPVNGGHIVRTGYELGLDVDILRKQDLFWRTGITLTHYNERWEERFEETDLASYQRETDPTSVIYAWETDGILDLGEEAPEWQPDAATVAGSPIFVDQNGDAVLDSADVKKFSVLPDVSIGLNNTFNYKNFDLTVMLYGQVGAYRYNNSLQWANPNGMLGSNLSGIQEMKYVWTTENQDGWLPGASFRAADLGTIGNVAGVGTDSYVSRADFLRARNITLGYTFNSSMLNNLVSELRVYLDVQNAFVITNYEGADPEVRQDGVKGAPAPYPMVRTFTFGVDVNF
ncbi:SusC/RagA family TonB-linked outer membrane protein [Aliifodinibius sp. S!AR15-10]|uniref:SusC/RagA family TonB-linked outer membrane protein n=1 Tax=Aliifodinibius sp. S!AR15-10 TaxID=2950437 RepID=UPI002861301E|nr:SusC/RagA family TonB-linked outer membrane protein [Aliifodinibius sp. S!AR15-10]MDR8394531.1 SusC/RagA family TonB-linked outer membrane protein [Aliifodinibius sp. S!AR15-10]